MQEDAYAAIRHVESIGLLEVLRRIVGALSDADATRPAKP
jgi:hypothetical protein